MTTIPRRVRGTQVFETKDDAIMAIGAATVALLCMVGSALVGTVWATQDQPVWALVGALVVLAVAVALAVQVTRHIFRDMRMRSAR